MTNRWTFWLTFLLCVSMSLTLVNSAGAMPATATHHGITESKITDYSWTEVAGGDTVYGAIIDFVNRSVNEGDSWTRWRNFDSSVEQIWCDDATGIVYLTVADTLKRCLPDGTCTDVLTFPVEISGNFPWMAKNDSLFVITYTSAEGVGDTTGAYIYRSSTGAHWTLANHPESRHYHFVATNAWNDTLWTSRGDTEANAHVLERSSYGTAWDPVRSSDCQGNPISFAICPVRAVFGSDCFDSVNKFYYTDDDGASFTVADSLTGASDSYIWTMTKNDERAIFAGTLGKAPTGNDIRMYGSWDSGGTWLSIKQLPDITTQYQGFKWMSQNSTATSGYMFYTLSDPSLSNTLDSYRFANIPIWTVGASGDFADVATALADFRVDAGDTLIMLANGGAAHVIEDDAMLANMTVRGATQDASLYLVKNGAADASGLIVGVAGVTFKDITLRTLTEITTNGKSMVEVTDGGQLTLARVAFRNCDANTAPGILVTGTGAGTTTLTLNDCIADSCSADTDDGLAGGFIYSVDADAITIDGLVATRNWSNRHGGALTIASHDGATLIENSLFVDNRCRDRAAAVYLTGPATLFTQKVWHCTFDGNESANVADGQLRIEQVQSNLVISHCAFTDSDSTYALSTAGYPDSVRHCDSWNTGNDNFGWNSPAATDTIHIDPIYNDTCLTAPCFTAKAKGCRDAADGSYMGWREYIPEDYNHGGHKRSARRRR